MSSGKSERVSPRLLAVIIGLALFGGGGAIALYLARLGVEQGLPKAPPPAPPPPPVAEAAPTRLAAPSLESEVHVGGRTAAWWSRRLTDLRAAGNTRLYDLTRRRAEEGGLTVREDPAAVEAQASTELLRRARDGGTP